MKYETIISFCRGEKVITIFLRSGEQLSLGNIEDVLIHKKQDFEEKKGEIEKEEKENDRMD